MKTAPVQRRGVDPHRVGDFPAFSVAATLLGKGAFADAAYVANDLLARYPEPAHPEAAYILGLITWWGERDAARAEELLRHVCQHRPDVAEYWYNLGFVRQRQDKTEAAVEAYERTLVLDPEFAGAYVNLGNAYMGQGRADEALAAYDRAIDAEAVDALARYNRAIAYLMLGRWTEGWAEYEQRWGNPEFLARAPSVTIPFWDGSPPKPDQRLLVFAEQGLGDTLLAWRYHEALHQRWGGRVTWAVQPELIPLLAPASASAVVPLGDTSFVATVALPAMSCMHRLGMPASGAPYLDRPPYCRGATPRVGYAWAGSPGHENDRLRSLPRAALDPLLAVPGIEWVDCQVGRGGTFQPTDYRETWERLGTLDLLISSDTSIAHCAGAMGLPVWLCTPALPDFRWGMHGERTIWYDSMRLIRQTQLGDWSAVIERIIADLPALLGVPA